MTRQSISLTEPNDDWLKAQLDSKEYRSKSEIINELIRHARQREEQEILRIRNILEQAEQSGVSKRTPEQIRKDILASMQNPL